MIMITEDYVSFETAKLLKEKGFDAECHSHYYPCNYPDGSIEYHKYEKTDKKNKSWYDIYSLKNLPKDHYLAPTLQVVMKWLREVHNIHPNIVCDDVAEFVFYRIERIFRTGKEHRWFSYYPSDDDKTGGAYPTYEQACEAAIKYCLENLI
jgi:hypothetical protein